MLNGYKAMSEAGREKRTYWEKSAMICRRYLSLLTSLFAALAVWMIFSPGNMSFDSFMQYREALTFSYSNWHPPLMSIMLSIVMFYGGGIGTLLLIQCMAGVLGIRALALVVLEQLSAGRWSPERMRWFATLAALLMLLPITPTAFYLVTFWKDSWEAIFFVWVAAFGMGLFRRAEELSRGAFLMQFGGLVTLMTLAGITRHNALVAMPAMGGMAWMIFARRGIRFSWLMVGLPIAASLFASAAIDRLYSVERYHPEDHVKILELIGLCITFPECREEFPYIYSHIRTEGEQSYRFGNIFSLTDPNGPVIKDRLLAFSNREVVQKEYLHAISRFPLRLLYVKWRAFCRLFDPVNIEGCYCQKRLDSNMYGLWQNTQFGKVRSAMILALEKSAQAPMINWIDYHNVWFSLNFAAILGLLIHLYRHRTSLLAFWILVMAIPLSYSLSYFAATTGWDYRFLYPSTLFMQVIGLSMAIFYGSQYCANKNA
jgi:hypothetical protein